MPRFGLALKIELSDEQPTAGTGQDSCLNGIRILGVDAQDAARQATMEVSLSSDLKSTPGVTGEVLMSDWRRIWSEVSRRYIEAKDSQGAIVELFGLYSKLDPGERKAANKELFEAIRAGDDLERWDALAIANKFKLTDAMPYLDELAARLLLDDSPGAPFELAKVQKIIERLQSPT